LVFVLISLEKYCYP